LVKEYISSTKQPNKLDLEILNYKAMLFYFIDRFISDSDSPLDLSNYLNRLAKKEIFENLFVNGKIFINTKYTNFPHLIGYKEEAESPHKKTNKQFLESIFYETNLIKDFSDHGCKRDKIETFSWIWNTLNKPTYIFLGDAISDSSNLEADIIFVRKKTKIISRTEKQRTYHYVSLIKIDAVKNTYVINSHHPLTHSDFTLQFDINKKIYEFNY
jgi:hypothetical protein